MTPSISPFVVSALLLAKLRLAASRFLRAFKEKGQETFFMPYAHLSAGTGDPIKKSSFFRKVLCV